MLRISRQDAFSSEIDSALNGHDINFKVCAIGVIDKYYPENSTIDVQLTTKLGIRDENGNVESQKFPLLPDIPVVFPHSKEHAITFPLQPGDEVLLVFADSAIDNWYQNGGTDNEQNLGRTHSPCDAIAIPGPYCQKTKMGENDSEQPNKDSFQIRSYNGKTYIEIESDSNKYNINVLNDTDGNLDIKIQNGTATVFAKKDISVSTDANISATAKGNISLSADGNINITAKGNVNVRGATINLN